MARTADICLTSLAEQFPELNEVELADLYDKVKGAKATGESMDSFFKRFDNALEKDLRDDIFDTNTQHVLYDDMTRRMEERDLSAPEAILEILEGREGKGIAAKSNLEAAGAFDMTIDADPTAHPMSCTVT